jgi:hypothetical protein
VRNVWLFCREFQIVVQSVSSHRRRYFVLFAAYSLSWTAIDPQFEDARLPEGPARRAVLDNLNDEVSPPSHLTLFEQFAYSFDASDAAISPATSHLVESYAALLGRGPEAALAGLWAYEGQGAQIAQSKAEGLITHYGAQGDALAFWTAHGSIEDDHAKWTLEALSLLEPDLHEVAFGAGLIAEAWWLLLDERELLAA